MKKEFAVSTAAHLLALLALAFFSGSPDSHESRESTPPLVEITQLSVPPARPQASGPVAAARARGNGKRHANTRRPRRLALGLVKRSSPQGEGPTSGHAARVASEGGDAYETARGMGLEREGELQPFFSELWKRIDAATRYPDVFIRQRLGGSASFQLMVHPDGTFTGRVLSMESDSPLLKTYALALLIHALQRPLPKHRWAASTRDLALAVRFDFDLLLPGELPKERDPRQFKNILSVKREVHVDTILNEKVQEVLTRYMPPIIILPGAFYVDVVRLYKFVQNWDKADSKAKEENELALLRKQWQDTIRAGTGSAE